MYTSTLIFFRPTIAIGGGGSPEALESSTSIALSVSSPALAVTRSISGATTISFLPVGDVTKPAALSGGSSIAIASTATAALSNIKPVSGSSAIAIANAPSDLEVGVNVAAVFDLHVVADAVVDLEVHGPLLSDATVSIDNPSPVLARTVGLSGAAAIAFDGTGLVGGSVELRGELTPIALSGWGAFGMILESYTTSVSLAMASPTLRRSAALFGNFVDSASPLNVAVNMATSSDLVFVTNSLTGVATVDVINNNANLGAAIKLAGRADVAIVCSAALSVALHNSARFFFREQILQLG